MIMDNYGQQNFNPQYRKYPEEGRATTILVLGALSLGTCLGPFTGVPAWIMGHNDLKKIDNGIINPAVRKETKIGMILGVISTCLTVVVTLIIIAISLR